MSKIGRKPIDISGVSVEIDGLKIRFKGPKDEGVHQLPSHFTAQVEGNLLTITPTSKTRDTNRLWGLHRALLANAIQGAKSQFAKIVEIIGLGYKAALSGDRLVISLGYSHKIDFPLPSDISVDIDKTGQKLTVKSSSKESVGKVCSELCELRPPEPYKGTGVKLSTDVIRRKAGKAKGA